MITETRFTRKAAQTLLKELVCALSCLMLMYVPSLAEQSIQAPNDLPIRSAENPSAASSTNSTGANAGAKASNNADPIAGADSLALGTPPTSFLAPTAGSKSTAKAKRDPYAEEKQKQLQPARIGSSPVSQHKEELEPIPYQSKEDKQEENLLPLSKPALKALISVDKHLDPFGLESSYSEEVGLREVLQSSIGSNLDIMNVRANERVQKYAYLSALSKFLPDAIMSYNLYYADGNLKLPGGFVGAGAAGILSSSINTPFTMMNAGLRYKLYQGGAVLFGAMQNKHLLKAAKAEVKGNTNDVLLTAARRYYELLRQEAILHIRIRAVDTSTEQLRRNTDLEASGLATNLDILQARTQLARDRQNLVDQQSIRRNSAIQLAQTLNTNLGQDLIPSDRVVAKTRLITRDMQIGELLKIAIDNRAELKQYDELRQAAKAQIMTALAPLHPTVAFTTSGYGVGPRPSQMGAILVLGLGINWTLGGMGLTDSLNAQSAKMKSRQALIRANQEFVTVFGEVRSAYVNMLSSEQRIEETTDEVYSAQEELRLSRLRLDNGLGTNLDVLTAQRDVTQAYIDKVEAIVNFNVAQAQLLHDIGLISVDTMTASRPIACAPLADHFH